MFRALKLATILLSCICTQDFTNVDSPECRCKAACAGHFLHSLAGSMAASKEVPAGMASELAVQKANVFLCTCLL